MEDYFNNDNEICSYKGENKCKYMNSYKNVFIINGNRKSNIINLPIKEDTSEKSIIVDSINIDTSCCYDTNIKLEFNINIFKGKGVKISKINFQVFKICDNTNCKVPVGQSLVYNNNNLNESVDLFNITVYDNEICNGKRCIYLLEAIV